MSELKKELTNEHDADNESLPSVPWVAFWAVCKSRDSAREQVGKLAQELNDLIPLIEYCNDRGLRAVNGELSYDASYDKENEEYRGE